MTDDARTDMTPDATDEPIAGPMDEVAAPSETSDDRVEQAVQNIADLGDPYEDETVWAEDVPAEDEGFANEEPAEVEGELVEDEGDDPLAMASDAARSAHSSILESIAAFKSVREATQRHSNARDELREIREQLDEHTAELTYRIDIEQRYPQIIAEQTAELEAATALSHEALERAERLEAERDDLDSQLAIMKNRHEDQLRPYRNVAESTKGRADDAARSLADARRAVKSAENNLAEMTRRRDQRISSANRAVDNAQERLRQVQAEYDSLQNDSEASPAAVSRLQNELASEQAHLESATADVSLVTEEARQSVESAQARLFDQKRVLAQAERDAEAAKKEATERRAEYDSMLKEAQDEERALSDQLRMKVTAAEQARQEIKEAEARISEAQVQLDEAEAIHSTPRETIALREQIAREQTDHDVLQDTVDELAANERELRRSTLKQRLMLIVGLVVVVLIIIAVLVAIFMRR